MKLSSYLPAELWDLILSFFPIKDLTLTKLISSFFSDLIEMNKGLKYKILLCKKGKGELSLIKQVRRVAKKGNLEALKWLYYTFNLSEEDMKSKDYAICRRAVYYGQNSEARLEILKWFHSTFGLTKEIIMAYNNFIFLNAACHGYLNILKWLHSTFDLSLDDIRFDRDNINFIIKETAEKGHLEVLKWIHATFKLTDEEIRYNNNKIFRSIIKPVWHGRRSRRKELSKARLEVLKWLHSTFDLQIEKEMFIACGHSSNAYLLLIQIAQGGDLEILKWLIFTFNISKKEALRMYGIHSGNGLEVKMDKIKTLEWLIYEPDDFEKIQSVKQKLKIVSFFH